MITLTVLLSIFSWSLWGLAALILWIWALADIIGGTFVNSNTKIMWIIIVALIPFLGSILYLVFGREQRSKL